MTIYKNIQGLIGNTPLVELQHFDTGPCRLFVKLESKNPGGSIKDRIALAMIETAEREGHIKPGDTLVEATAGNTGMALAMVAALKGYRLLTVVPDKMSHEKIAQLRARGAEVVLTRSDVGRGDPEYYQDLAERLARERDNAFYIGQFANQANPEAHYKTTAPEIWAQMEHNVDAIVAGCGTGGHMTGLSRYFAEVAPEVKMVLADPEGSILAHYIKTGEMIEKGAWLVEGIGEDYIPKTCNLDRVKEAITVSDRDSFSTARELVAREGIFAGSSTGTVVSAALAYCRAQTSPQRVVTFVYDSGNNYLSKMYNDQWMVEQGFAVALA